MNEIVMELTKDELQVLSALVSERALIVESDSEYERLKSLRGKLDRMRSFGGTLVQAPF